LASGEETRQLDIYDYLDYPTEVRSVLGMELRGWSGLSSGNRAVLLEFLVDNIAPNLHLNQSETLRRQAAATAAVEQVYNRVRKGQVIVRKGDQIDASGATLMAELARGRGARAQLLPLFGTLLLMTAVALVLWLGVRRESLF